MQQYADIYLLQSHSTCFGCHNTHHKGHNTGTATSLQRGQIGDSRSGHLMMGAVTPDTCGVTSQ